MNTNERGLSLKPFLTSTHSCSSVAESSLGAVGTCECLLMICDFCAFLWRVLSFIGGDTFGEGVPMDAEDDGSV